MAFDAHRDGPFDGKRVCSFPEGHGLIERVGDCDIAGDSRKVDVTVYYAAEGATLRGLFAGREAISPDPREAA